MFNRKAMTCILGGLLVLWSAVAFAAPPGGHLNIEEVVVTIGDPDTTIEINGWDFDFGSPLEVTLAGVPAAVMDATGVTITATVPTSLFPAGDYLLTVSTGNGQSQNDEYDLTIGAVGPQGEQGDQGDQGDHGIQGEQGIQGIQGEQGPQGEKGQDGLNGLNGQDGADCYDGIGDSVADCIGPQGNQGPTGPEGPQGEPGTSGSATNTYLLRSPGPSTDTWDQRRYLFCDRGDQVIGGSVTTGSSGRIVSSWPGRGLSYELNATEPRDYWFGLAAAWVIDENTTSSISVWTICMDSSPGNPNRSYTEENVIIDCVNTTSNMFYCNR